MFGTIRKHQTWLWVVIIVVIIISFVIYFSPYSNLNQEVRTADFGSISGEKVTREQFARAERDVFLRYFMMTGRWPDNEAQRQGFDLEREAYQWLFLQREADELGIQVGPDIVVQQAQQMLRPMEQVGITSPSVFSKQVLEPRGFTLDDYERFVRNFTRIQHLIPTVGMSGTLVTPEEIKALYRRENQEVATRAVFFTPSNYLSKVTVTPEAVSQFYSNRLANYRIPERIQVAYVKFDLSNYLAAAAAEIGETNLNELVESNVARLGTNLNRIAASPEEARQKIRQELLQQRALPEARRKASEFAGPLFDQAPMQAQALEEQAQKQGLEVKVTQPFSREQGPPDLAVGEEFTQAAFRLSAEEPISRPIVGEDGVYIMALKNRLPSEVPPLDQVRAKVTEDFKEAQAISLARQAGMSFHTTLTNALAQGKSFEAVAKEQNLEPVSLPPFSLSTRSLPAAEQHMNLNQLKQLAYSTEPGQVTPFQPTAEGGAILFVKEKLPVDEAKMQAELPQFSTLVRRSRQEEAFNDWFRREGERALRDVPYFRQQQQRPPPQISSGKAS